MQTGELQLKDRFQTWSINSKVADVAVYAKEIFMFHSDALGTKQPLNPSALQLYVSPPRPSARCQHDPIELCRWKRDREAFFAQAARCAQRSALGHTPPGSPARTAAAGSEDLQRDDAGIASGFSSFLKNVSSSVLGMAAEGKAETSPQLPAVEDHLMQFQAPAQEIADIRRFVTSQERSGPELVRFLTRGQRSADLSRHSEQ